MKEKTEPRPRKLARLHQAYTWWESLMEMRKASDLRISAVEREASNLDADFEQQMKDALHLDEGVEMARKTMIELGETAGLIWDWGIAIKGLGAGGLYAQLLARIDDIGKFDTISKLWRHAGWAPGDHPKRGEKRHYDAKLKGIMWNVVQSFIKQQTSPYADEYYTYKERKRREHPHAICNKCGGQAEKQGQKWKCTECGQGAQNRALKYTDAHLHAMAIRKTAKLFLSQLWLKWRESEGLPVSEPYVQAVMGHTNIL